MKDVESIFKIVFGNGSFSNPHEYYYEKGIKYIYIGTNLKDRFHRYLSESDYKIFIVRERFEQNVKKDN